MGDHFLSFRNSRLHYTCRGTGPRLLFCFHGYGESARTFTFLEEPLRKDYTIIALDMPFHGSTEWNENLFFNPDDLPGILDELATTLPSPPKTYTLLGYSMGGRIALHLLQQVPEKIDRLILLAPDGLTMNPWYWLATQTTPGNRLFRYTMTHPSWFFALARIGNRLKLINPGIYKFTIRYIDDVKVRNDLYTRWTTMRGFRPHLQQLKTLIRSRNIPVRLIFGRFDRIILAKMGELFKRGIEQQCILQLLPSGHQLLQAANLDIILSAITS